MISVHIYKVRQSPTPELFTFPDCSLFLNEGCTSLKARRHILSITGWGVDTAFSNQGKKKSSQIQYSGGRTSTVKYGLLLWLPCREHLDELSFLCFGNLEQQFSPSVLATLCLIDITFANKVISIHHLH